MAWGKNICINIGTWIEDAGERDCTRTFRSYIYIYIHLHAQRKTGLSASIFS